MTEPLPNAQQVEDREWAEREFGAEPLDFGILRILRIFREQGIETAQSCEGPDGENPRGRHGQGHSYRAPTIDIYGQPWKALDVANQHAAQVDQISEIFRIEAGRPVEHFWRVEFNSAQLAAFRTSWYGDRQPTCTIVPPDAE